MPEKSHLRCKEMSARTEKEESKREGEKNDHEIKATDIYSICSSEKLQNQFTKKQRIASIQRDCFLMSFLCFLTSPMLGLSALCALRRW